MSYRRYQRSLGYHKCYDDENRLRTETSSKSVTFHKEVTEIPQNLAVATQSESIPTNSTIIQETPTGTSAASLSTNAATTNSKKPPELTNEISSKIQESLKARAEAKQLRASMPLTRSLVTCDPGKGKYINWSTQHAILAEQSWCCVSDLIAFCDKYEFTSISLRDTKTHRTIVAEITALLNTDTAPFNMRRRFPGNIHDPENLWVCLGRCAGVEYHLKRILSVFRKPLDNLTPDKQRMARQNFHLAVNELRLDISARISDVRLYDRHIFESDFNLKWQDDVTD